jgi:hypothetical protein
LEATEDISGDKYISISLIIPLVKMLLKVVSSGRDVPLPYLLQRELQRRFSQIEHRFTLAIATLLDPRFKTLAFADTSAVERVVRKIKEDILNKLTSESEENEENPSHSTETEPFSSSSLWASFDETVSRATSHRTIDTDSFIEVKRYFEARVINRIDDPLK